jgi:hypothetical protein
MVTASSGSTRKPARKAPAPKPSPAKRAAAAKPSRAGTPSPALAKAKAPAARKKAEAVSPLPMPKTKLVRDSFTMPQQDFDLIASLKKRAIAFGRPAKKSELLRAGLHALTQLDEKRLHAALESLIQLKAGRPPKET